MTMDTDMAQVTDMMAQVTEKASPLRILRTPPLYIQGPGALSLLAQVTASFGDRFGILTEDFLWDMKKDVITGSFEESEKSFFVIPFQGECCRKEINRIQELLRENKGDALIAFGGGKLMDAGKYAASCCSIPFISVPSIASTDAPCSSVAVIYTEDGRVERSENLPQNPQLVLVDSQLIAAAPLGLFVAGMGDALATYFETRTALEQGCRNISGGLITTAALALSQACFQVLMADGRQAKKDLEEKKLTAAVERVIEGNTYLSGIGFESGGLSAAHGIHNAFKTLPQLHGANHGEIVAFGTLCLLALENRPSGDYEAAFQFCRDVGLPTTLAQLGLTAPLEELEPSLRSVATAAMHQPSKYHMPPDATEETVYRAILRVNETGCRQPR